MDTGDLDQRAAAGALHAGPLPGDLTSALTALGNCMATWLCAWKVEALQRAPTHPVRLSGKASVAL